MGRIRIWLLVSALTAAIANGESVDAQGCVQATLAFQEPGRGFSSELFTDVVDLIEVPMLPSAARVRQQVDVAIVSEGEPRETWIQAWSVAVSMGLAGEDPARIDIVEAFIDRTRPLMDSYLVGGFEHTVIVDPEALDDEGRPQGQGFVSTAVPGVLPHELPPRGTVTIATLIVEAERPTSGSREARLSFADSLRQPFGRPVKTQYTLGGVIVPACHRRDLRVRFAAVEAAPFLRCDANSDGKFDISDPIETLRALFEGTSSLGCRVAGDCNGDDNVDVSDAIFALNFNFAGGRPPPAPFPACEEATKLGDVCPPVTTGCASR